MENVVRLLLRAEPAVAAPVMGVMPMPEKVMAGDCAHEQQQKEEHACAEAKHDPQRPGTEGSRATRAPRSVGGRHSDRFGRGLAVFGRVRFGRPRPTSARTPPNKGGAAPTALDYPRYRRTCHVSVTTL